VSKPSSTIIPSERRLSDVLSEFARTMLTEFPIQGILDELVGQIVEIMPITGAGVTLISASANSRYIAASDRSALGFERLQDELGEGPCVAAFRTADSQGFLPSLYAIRAGPHGLNDSSHASSALESGRIFLTLCLGCTAIL
jgi:hypothetical protein